MIVRYTTADCCKVMAAWVRSVMTGRRRNGREKEIEAWWVGWRSHELVSQEGRVVTGCFRMTNFGGWTQACGCPARERQRQFGLRLLSLPHGDQAKEVVSAASGIGKRLESALGHAGRKESTVHLEAPEALDTAVLEENHDSAKAEAERFRTGLTIFADGAMVDSRAAVAVWKRGKNRGGRRGPYGAQPGSLRCGVCSAGQGP